MAVSDSLTGAVEFARQKPAVAAGIAALVMGGGAFALIRARKGAGAPGTASMIYGAVGDSSKFPADGYPAVIVTQPGATAPDPKPISEPSKTPAKPSKPAKTGGKPGDILSQKGMPFYCPSGSILTWEKGGTGNKVCQRKDGVQFAVRPR